MTTTRKLFYIIILIYLSIKISFSQISPDNLRIYLLTYSPGSELYSTFGHSAIRVIDLFSGSDLVYNYGTFDFAQPQFYLNFIKGKLEYNLSRVPTSYVIDITNREKRSLIQNELKINPFEKHQLVKALEINYKPQNRTYTYNFLYDNCATRIYHIIDSVTSYKYSPAEFDYKAKRFNSLIKKYLTNHLWAKFGINIVGGRQLFMKSSPEESIFLPDNLKFYMELLYNLNNIEKKLIGENEPILYHPRVIEIKIITPSLILTIVLVLSIILTSFANKKNNLIIINDIILFVPVISLGFLLAAIWVISEHDIFAWNINLLWTNPLFLVFLFKKYRFNKLLLKIGLISILLNISLLLYFIGFYFPIFLINIILLIRFIYGIFNTKIIPKYS